MTEDEFLDKVSELLDLKERVNRDADLTEIPTFDSLGMLNLLDLYDSLGVQLQIEDLKNATTARELLALASSKVAA